MLRLIASQKEVASLENAASHGVGGPSGQTPMPINVFKLQTIHRLLRERSLLSVNGFWPYAIFGVRSPPRELLEERLDESKRWPLLQPISPRRRRHDNGFGKGLRRVYYGPRAISGVFWCCKA